MRNYIFLIFEPKKSVTIMFELAILHYLWGIIYTVWCKKLYCSSQRLSPSKTKTLHGLRQGNNVISAMSFTPSKAKHVIWAKNFIVSKEKTLHGLRSWHYVVWAKGFTSSKERTLHGLSRRHYNFWDKYFTLSKAKINSKASHHRDPKTSHPLALRLCMSSLDLTLPNLRLNE